MALIEIWVDEGIQQQLDSCTRKRPIFEKIARRLQGEGEYIRTFAQVREKIKQLKQSYKKIKNSNNRSISSTQNVFRLVVLAATVSMPYIHVRHLKLYTLYGES